MLQNNEQIALSQRRRCTAAG